MVIQDFNGIYNYAGNNLNSQTKPSNDEVITNDTHTQEKELNMDRSSLKTINAPTKIYIDNVITNALDNIARGNNIEDNKRIIRLFSNLIQENPENLLRKAYGM